MKIMQLFLLTLLVESNTEFTEKYEDTKIIH